MPGVPGRTLNNEDIDEPMDRAGEQAIQDTRAEGLLELEQIRARLAGGTFSNSLELLREDRALI
jgi:hypothetical protein